VVANDEEVQRKTPKGSDRIVGRVHNRHSTFVEGCIDQNWWDTELIQADQNPLNKVRLIGFQLLWSRGAVNMHYRRSHTLSYVRNLCAANHVSGEMIIARPPLARVTPACHGSEWPPGLPTLYLIESPGGVNGPGQRQNRAMAQGSRPDLSASLDHCPELSTSETVKDVG
jgi:hypothetical protein